MSPSRGRLAALGAICAGVAAEPLIARWPLEDAELLGYEAVSGDVDAWSGLSSASEEFDRSSTGFVAEVSSAVTVQADGVSGSQPRTISVWVRSTTTWVGEAATLFDAGSSTMTGEDWSLGVLGLLSSCPGCPVLAGGGAVQLVADGTVTDGVWHHVAAVQRAGGSLSDAEIWIDGRQPGSNALSNAANTTINTTASTASTIGSSAAAGIRLHDLRWYAGALPARAIEALSEPEGDVAAARVNGSRSLDWRYAGCYITEDTTGADWTLRGAGMSYSQCAASCAAWRFFALNECGSAPTDAPRECECKCRSSIASFGDPVRDHWCPPGSQGTADAGVRPLRTSGSGTEAVYEMTPSTPLLRLCRADGALTASGLSVSSSVLQRTDERFGESCFFPGTAGAVLNVTSSIPPPRPATVTMWVNRDSADSTSSTAALVSWLGWGGQYAILRIASGVLEWAEGGEGGAATVTATVPLLSGAWRHVAAVSKAGGGVSLYVDGMQVADGDVGYATRVQWTALTVGGDGTALGYWRGFVHDVEIFAARGGWGLLHDSHLRRSVAAQLVPHHYSSSGDGVYTREEQGAGGDGAARRWCLGSFADVAAAQDARPEYGARLAGADAGTPPPGVRACDLGGGRARVPASVHPRPLTVTSWVRWPSCSASNDTAELAALLGWGGSLQRATVGYLRDTVGDMRLTYGTGFGETDFSVATLTCSEAEGRWMHVAVSVAAGGEAAAYIGGATWGSATAIPLASNVTSAWESKIGGMYGEGGPGGWSGSPAQVSDIRMYTDALGPEEVGRAATGDALTGLWCGSGGAADSSLHAQQTVVGTASWSKDNGCNFDGSESSAVAAPLLRARPSQLTVAAWVKLNPGCGEKRGALYRPRTGAVLNFTSVTDDTEAALMVGDVLVWRETGSAGAATATAPREYWFGGPVPWDDEGASPARNLICDGEWHHVAATVGAGGAVSLFLDGVRMSVVTHGVQDGPPTTYGTAAFDGGALVGGYGLYGYLKDVRLYSRQLREDEVSSLARAGLSLSAVAPGVRTSGLAVRVCAGSWYDVSGWQRHATASSAPSLEYEHRFADSVCQFDGGYAVLGNTTDRPAGFTVSLWARRTVKTGTNPSTCEYSDPGGYLSWWKRDESSVEWRAGPSGWFAEGAVPATRNEYVRFGSCNSSSSSLSTSCLYSGGTFQRVKIGYCVEATLPCGTSSGTYMVVSLNAGRQSVTVTTYSLDGCVSSDQTGSTIYDCGVCTGSMQWTHIGDLPCGTRYDTTAELRAGTSGVCDLSWHHFALVVPPARTQAALYIDGLRAGVGNASALEWPNAATVEMRIGSAWDADGSAEHGVFTGGLWAAVYDWRFYSSGSVGGTQDVLDMAGCRRGLRWARVPGVECGYDYVEFEGASLAQCKDECLSTPECRAVSFPLRYRTDGCRIHAGGAGMCWPVGTGTYVGVDLYHPAVLCGGDHVGRWCVDQLADAALGLRGGNGTGVGVSSEIDDLFHAAHCEFGGTTDGYLYVSSYEAAHRPSAFTVAAFLRVTQTCGSSSAAVFYWAQNWKHGATDVPGTGVQSLGLDSNGVLYWGSTYANTTAPLPLCRPGGGADAVWRHVAATMTSTGVLTLYVDGTAVGWSAGRHAWTAGGMLRIGQAWVGLDVADAGGRSWAPYSGDMHDVGLWDRELTHSEVAGLMRSGTAGGDGLLGRWCVNGSETIDDVSNYHRHPTWVRGVAGAADVGVHAPACRFSGSPNTGVEWSAAGGALPRPAPVTFSVWLRLRQCTSQPIVWWHGVPGTGALLSTTPTGGLGYSEVQVSGAAAEVVSTPNATTTAGAFGGLCDTSREWHHVAMTIDEDQVVQLYIDGNKSASGTLKGGPGRRAGAEWTTRMSLGRGAAPGDFATCPYGWDAVGSKCVKYFNQTQSRASAAVWCADQPTQEGGTYSSGWEGRLVQVQSAAEQQHVEAFNATTWLGLVRVGGYWRWDSIDGSNATHGEPVGFWPSGEALGSEYSCAGMEEGGAWATSLCTSRTDYGALCEMQKIPATDADLWDARLYGAVLDASALADIVESTAAPTATATKTLAEAESSESTAGSLARMSAADSSGVITVLPVVDQSVRLWAEGTLLRDCSLRMYLGSAWRSYALTVVGATGSSQVAVAEIPASDGASFAEGDSSPVWLICGIGSGVGRAPGYDSPASNFTITVNPSPAPTAVWQGVKGTRMSFTGVANWKQYPEAVVGLAETQDTCAEPVGGTGAIYGAEALVRPRRGSGGRYVPCVRLSPSHSYRVVNRTESAPAHGAATTVPVYGDCNGNGVFVHSLGVCRCYGDEQRGYWQGTDCTSCREGWAGCKCRSRCTAATCSYNGRCAVDGSCVCDPGFAGANCASLLSCDRVTDAIAMDGVPSAARHSLDGDLRGTDGRWLSADGNYTLTADGAVRITDYGSRLVLTLSPTVPDFTREGAYSVWVRNLGFDLEVGGTVLCTVADGTEDRCLGVAGFSNYLSLAMNATSNATVLGTMSVRKKLAESQWHLLAATWGGGIARLYVDGALHAEESWVQSKPRRCDNGQCAVWIGGSITSDLRDLRVFAHAILPADVKAVWAAGVPGIQSVCPGQCDAFSTLAVFPFRGGSLADSKAELKATYKGNVSAGTLTDDGVYLDGSGWIDTGVEAPADGWAVSIWFRTLPQNGYGCLYSAGYRQPGVLPSDHVLAHAQLLVTTELQHDFERATAADGDADFAFSFFFVPDPSDPAPQGGVAALLDQVATTAGDGFGMVMRTSGSGEATVSMRVAAEQAERCNVTLPSFTDTYHFVAQRSSGALQLYVDGALAAECDGNGTVPSTSTLRIGGACCETPSNSSAVGTFKLLRAYERALTPQEVQSLAGVLEQGAVDRRLCLFDEGDVVAEVRTTPRTMAAAIPYPRVSVADGRWHHVVHTAGRAQGGQRLYVDGLHVGHTAALAAVQPAGHTPSHRPRFFIGSGGAVPTAGSPSYFFEGEVSDLRLYSRTLAPDEVIQLSQRRHAEQLPPGFDDRTRFSQVTLPNGMQVRRFSPNRGP
eukprot:TRINITY_DN19813_c0_g1_i3.p1 TRINITY_DN19813_c0_g1~~TRINITY_DN19813_c0_g1_i3.p1  ORF type:complete len:3022 (+),score=707.24 TRINITY_DN19813_c0_g1_i3:43-9108(+)